jgi:hypothetical protein
MAPAYHYINKLESKSYCILSLRDDVLHVRMAFTLPCTVYSSSVLTAQLTLKRYVNCA